MIWTILGVSVGILAVFCVAVAEFLVGRPLFENHREYVAAGLAASGIVAWFVGRRLARKKPEGGEPDEDGAKTFLLFDLRYWGPLLLSMGMIALFIQKLSFHQEKAEMIAPPPAPKKVELVVVPEPKSEPKPKKGPVVFPAIHLQGVILRRDQPMAILDGRSYSVGDIVGEATVKAITRDGVSLEKLGEVKLFSLR
jgi:hypothetical protein